MSVAKAAELRATRSRPGPDAGASSPSHPQHGALFLRQELRHEGPRGFGLRGHRRSILDVLNGVAQRCEDWRGLL